MLYLFFLLLMQSSPVSSIYTLQAEAIDGTMIDFSKYKGKKLLIVNTASKCGFTPQYNDLQELHQQYGDQITILGFPSNNFGWQEPGSNEEIATFCKVNYGVTFQMFSKIDVKGKDQHPLYRWLSSKGENGWNDDSPSWNFCKYLIDEEGKLVAFYKSGTNPFDEEILQFIEGDSAH